jgi:hypothetical protein
MPFSEPTPLIIEVTLADIEASTPGRLTNSLITAIKRLGQNLQLPGQQNDTQVQSCIFYAETNLRLNNGQLIALCDAFVCTRAYATDLNTAIIVALENVSGIKPTAPYTATLVHE